LKHWDSRDAFRVKRKLRFFAALQRCLDLAMSRFCRQEAHLILIVECQSNVEGGDVSGERDRREACV